MTRFNDVVYRVGVFVPAIHMHSLQTVERRGRNYRTDRAR